jgi:hypothetical protein
MSLTNFHISLFIIDIRIHSRKWPSWNGGRRGKAVIDLLLVKTDIIETVIVVGSFNG